MQADAASRLGLTQRYTRADIEAACSGDIMAVLVGAAIYCALLLDSPGLVPWNTSVGSNNRQAEADSRPGVPWVPAAMNKKFLLAERHRLAVARFRKPVAGT